MAKLNIPSEPKIYIALAVVFVMLLLTMPRAGKFKYNYKKGSPWTYETLVAQFDFPILKTDEQILSEKENLKNSILPYYNYSESASNSALKTIENIELGKYAYLKQNIITSVSDIFSIGVIDNKEYDTFAKDDERVDAIYIQKGKRASKKPVSEVYTVSSAQSKLLSDIAGKNKEINADSILESNNIYSLIIPNLIYDNETTELVNSENEAVISPTSGYVSAGQVIVSKGELVTSDIQQMLDSYKSEYENNLGYSGPRIKLWAGNGLIALVLVLLLFMSLFYTFPLIFIEFNKYIYILTIFIITCFSSILIENINTGLLYLTPFTLTALYLLAFFKKRVVLTVYTISLLPLLIFAHNGIELFVMYLAAGVVTMYVFEYFNRGWRQFVTAFIVFITLTTVYFGFRFINDVKGTLDIEKVVYLFLGSMLSVAGYPLIFLFEKIYRLISNSRLQELCDTNGNRLLSELSSKAPGTFQHCLQVMNLCDAAAKSIDANVLLVRAGALYHDIGKMNNPLCFIENDTLGTKYHEGLSAKESARDIIRHVSDGMALAEKYHLPQIIKDFIVTHHGTSCTGYFYNKYLNEGGDPSDTSDFYYKGEKPKTKEQTILMLCDTIEAASRTLKDNKPETYDLFVEKMFKAKIDAGQLSEADISIKELNTIKSVLKSYIAQMYHSRVVYPKRKR